MAQLLVRNLEDEVKERLRQRAKRHGRSTEEEVRELLRHAAREGQPAAAPLGSRLRRARFASIGLEEDVPELKDEPARPAAFDP